jgi:hypothetical protein
VPVHCVIKQVAKSLACNVDFHGHTCKCVPVLSNVSSDGRDHVCSWVSVMNNLFKICSQVNSYVYTHSFFHGFGAYAPSVHAESVSVNAQPAETPGVRSLPTCPACRSELAWHSHGHSNTSVETLFPLSSRAVKSV